MTVKEVEPLLLKAFQQQEADTILEMLHFLESIQYAKIGLGIVEKDQMTQQTATLIHWCFEISKEKQPSKK